MVEEQFEEVEQPAPDRVEAPERPDELQWWEKQLGMPLPSALYTETATGR